MPSADLGENRSEVHSTYVKLTWQNAVTLIAILIPLIGAYFKLSSASDAIAARQSQTERVVEKLADVQIKQNDWLTEIAIKIGVSPPRKP
jgi:hypothetical protein